MKKLIAVLAVLFLFVGCNFNERQIVDRSVNDKMLACVYNDGIVLIFADMRTGVQYLHVGVCVTVMVDRDGKPLIYEGD